jgi:hypothetical protein
MKNQRPNAYGVANPEDVSVSSGFHVVLPRGLSAGSTWPLQLTARCSAGSRRIRDMSLVPVEPSGAAAAAAAAASSPRAPERSLNGVLQWLIEQAPEAVAEAAGRPLHRIPAHRSTGSNTASLHAPRFTFPALHSLAFGAFGGRHGSRPARVPGQRHGGDDAVRLPGPSQGMAAVRFRKRLLPPRLPFFQPRLVPPVPPSPICGLPVRRPSRALQSPPAPSTTAVRRSRP